LLFIFVRPSLKVCRNEQNEEHFRIVFNTINTIFKTCMPSTIVSSLFSHELQDQTDRIFINYTFDSLLVVHM